MAEKYIYIHYKLDTHEPFYVGQGIKNRINSKWNRNKYWSNTVNKHGFYGEKLFENLSLKEANELEILTIKQLKDWGIKLVIILPGGGNYIRTEETGIKISQKNKGHKHSEESKKKMSMSLKGRKIWNKGLKGSQIPWNIGITHSDETKKKMSLDRKGSVPWNKGLKGAQIAWNKGIGWSEEVKKKMSESRKGKVSSKKGKKYTK